MFGDIEIKKREFHKYKNTAFSRKIVNTSLFTWMILITKLNH